MPDFDRNEFNLSQLARKALDEVDAAIDLYHVRNHNPRHLILYPNQYLAVDRALKKQSDGKVSLDTHTYRGMKLVPTPERYRI